jgi:hypothetical protein
MKRNDDTVAILFVTVLAVLIWIWAATRTEDERNISTTLHFKAPEGSTSTIAPESKPVRLTFKGPRASLNTVEEICARGIVISVAADDGDVTINVTSRINANDGIRVSGAEVITADPSSLTLNIQTLVSVNAAVEPVLPSVTVSGDVTVDPSTVTLQIPKSIRNELPEVISVSAVLSEQVLEQLQPGVVHTRSASIRLPESLEDKGVIVEPNRVSLSFKIQSKTDKTVLPQVRVLIAGPAEDYAAFKVSLPVKIIPNVTIEADKALISSIASGDITVFAVVRLASRDMEQRIESKHVTTFLAMLGDGTGQQVLATVEDPAVLNVALKIEPVTLVTP